MDIPSQNPTDQLSEMKAEPTLLKPKKGWIFWVIAAAVTASVLTYGIMKLAQPSASETKMEAMDKDLIAMEQDEETASEVKKEEEAGDAMEDEKFCPKVAVDNEQNLVTLDGQPLEFTRPHFSHAVEGRDRPPVVDAVISDDCRFIAWKIHDVGYNVRTHRSTIFMARPDGSMKSNVFYHDSNLSESQTYSDSFDVRFGAFPGNLTLITGGGDNSPGPGYYPVGVEGAWTIENKTFLTNHLGTIIPMSEDGRWLVARSGSYIISLRDLKTGALVWSHSYENGPTAYSFRISPDGKFLLHAEIPGDESSRGYEYEGPSMVLVSELKDGELSEPKEIYRSNEGSGVWIREWVDDAHIKISSTEGKILLNIITGETEPVE